MASIRWVRCAVAGLSLLYLNMVLSNLVSWRQAWWQRQSNGTKLEPLYDSLFMDWFHGYRVPLSERITLRDMVDVCTYGWVITTCLVWFVCTKRKPDLIAKVITAQALIITVFSVSQLLTIVPDATPNCVELYNIPNNDEEPRWVLSRIPVRSCGNMLWSSDIAQLVIFTSVARQMVSKQRTTLKLLVTIIGELWIVITVAFILSSKYQYSMDVFVTILVAKLAMSHPTLTHIARYLFVKDAEYFERIPVQEMVTSQ